MAVSKELRLIDLMNMETKNVLALAYLGDAIYECIIREHLLKQGNLKVKELQQLAVSYVSAKNQCKFVKKMIESNFLNASEMDIVLRARNHKSHKSPKNTDVATYKYATGLESLIGYLYLEQNTIRIQEIMNYIKNMKEE